METHILDILNLKPFTKRAELRLNLQSRGYYLTDRQLRKEVEHLITKQGYAIASSEKGYSLITTNEQLDEAVFYLNSKANALHLRAKCLKENHFSGKLANQLSLSL